MKDNILQDLALVLSPGLGSWTRVEYGAGYMLATSSTSLCVWLQIIGCLWKGYVPNSFVENTLQVSLCEGRTFQILVCSDFLGHAQSLFVGDGLHFARSQCFGGGAVISEIKLGTDKDDGDVRGVMFDLGEPLW